MSLRSCGLRESSAAFAVSCSGLVGTSRCDAGIGGTTAASPGSCKSWSERRISTPSHRSVRCRSRHRDGRHHHGHTARQPGRRRRLGIGEALRARGGQHHAGERRLGFAEGARPSLRRQLVPTAPGRNTLWPRAVFAVGRHLASPPASPSPAGRTDASRRSSPGSAPEARWPRWSRRLSANEAGQIWRIWWCTTHWLGSVAVFGRSGVAGTTWTMR